ncbi:hypothetical protein MN608_01883 [Microdochium nivale]|nr:hypothetical protein MN608_01883 [Microdochium nivale]
MLSSCKLSSWMARYCFHPPTNDSALEPYLDGRDCGARGSKGDQSQRGHAWEITFQFQRFPGDMRSNLRGYIAIEPTSGLLIGPSIETLLGAVSSVRDNAKLAA